MYLAHGVGGRSDLPAPLWLAMYAAGAVVLTSFLVLVTFWSNPRFRGTTAGRPGPAGLQRLAENPVVRAVPRTAGLLLYLATLVVLAAGGKDASTNPAPTWVYVWLWVGLPLLSVVFGPVWRWVNPLPAITSGLRRLLPGPVRRRIERPYPTRWGYRPAAIGLAAFVWMELVYREASLPITLLVFILLYSAVNVGFGLRFGDKWFSQGDGFQVYSELMGRFSVLGRRIGGDLVLRHPFNGLASLGPKNGLVATVCVLLGSTAFDGLSRTRLWAGLVAKAGGNHLAMALIGTAGLAAAIALVSVLYVGATVGSAQARTAVRVNTGIGLPALFAHSLLPIVLGYTVAHYFSFFLFQGQAGYLLAADPFGLGWSLFGRPGRGIDYQVVSAITIGVVQVGAIVLGHISGVVSAHDRAMEIFPTEERLRGQLPLVITMIIFTMGGIALVTGAG